jgi:hypothetical protein
VSKFSATRHLLAAAAVVTILGFQVNQVRAASLAVQFACASDYYALCSKHDPDSPGARSCMRANGPNLSQSCIKALVSAGEVSKVEVSRRSATARR